LDISILIYWIAGLHLAEHVSGGLLMVYFLAGACIFMAPILIFFNVIGASWLCSKNFFNNIIPRVISLEFVLSMVDNIFQTNFIVN
jgi:hypothetical protein